MPDPIHTSRSIEPYPGWERPHPHVAYHAKRPVARPAATPVASWWLTFQALGIAIRITVCLGLFAGLLFFLLTYPAFLIGGFLCVALLARYARALHA